MAAINAVNAPTQVINNNAVEEYSRIGEALNNKYTPAVLYFYLYFYHITN